jgi:putative metalloprotease
MSKIKVTTILLAGSLLLVSCGGIGGGFSVGGLSPSKVLDIGENAYKAATLTDADVQKMSAEFVKELDAQSKIAAPSNPYAKRLQKIVARHKKEEGLNLNYKVYLQNEVNAFSTADGSIRVYSGLMDKMTDDELLFVIGHEIGHVKHGHRKARMQRGYAAAAAVGAIGQGLNGATSNTAAGFGIALGGNLVAQLAGEVLKAQFSQSDETESDEFGLHLVHRGKRPVNSVVSALLKLKDDEGGDSSTTLDQFTSTHPDPEARAEHIKELIPSLGESVPAVPDPATSISEKEKSSDVAMNKSSQTEDSSLPRDTRVARLDTSSPTPETSEGEAPKTPAKFGSTKIQNTKIEPNIEDSPSDVNEESFDKQPQDKRRWFIRTAPAKDDYHGSFGSPPSLNYAHIGAIGIEAPHVRQLPSRVIAGPFKTEQEAKNRAAQMKQQQTFSHDALVIVRE